MADQVRSRAWCFTLNNWVEHGWENWQDRLKSLSGIKYLVCEEEVGKEGTPHLQGYIRFSNAKTAQRMHSFFEGFAHVEVAKGSDDDSTKYCKKDGINILEIGTPFTRKSGKKIDWCNLINEFDNNDVETFIYKYPRESLLYFNKLCTLSTARQQLNEQTCYEGPLGSKNFWIYGAPRTGKSSWARRQCKSIYLKSCNKWWSGYQTVFKMVLMEDFPPYEQTKGALGQHMKLWSDRYTFTAETKGSHLFIHPKDYVFIVTSNYSIDECFAAGDVEAIKGRFQEVLITGKDDLWFQCVMEIDDILRGNCEEDHAVHCT